MKVRPALHTALSFMILLITLTSVTDVTANDSEMLESRPEAKLGLGWNSVTNEPTSRREFCIDLSSTSIKDAENKDAENKDARYQGSFRLIHTKTDIEDGFGLSLSASYRGLIYSAKGSASYAQKQTVNVENINAAGFVTVETRGRSLHSKGSNFSATTFVPSHQLDGSLVVDQVGGLSLKSKYLQLLKSNPKQFYQICGDSFVSDIYFGGRLNVVATLATVSVSDKRKLESSLSGSGGGADSC